MPPADGGCGLMPEPEDPRTVGYLEEIRLDLLGMLDDLAEAGEDCRRRRRRRRKRKSRGGKPWVVFLPGGNPVYADETAETNPVGAGPFS